MPRRSVLLLVPVLLLASAHVPPAFGQEACSATGVTVPVRVSLDVLHAALERELPANMRGADKIDLPGISGEEIEWSLNRSALRLSTDGGRVLADTAISGRVGLSGRLLPIGPDLNVGVDLNADARLRMRPAFTADWRVRPNAEASADVRQATIGTPIGDMSVRGVAQEAVDRFLGRLAADVNENLAGDDALTGLGRQLWESLHRTVNVEMEPPLWLVVIPTGIGATRVRVEEDGIVFGVSVAGGASVVSGDRPAQEAPGELPGLDVGGELPEGGVELAVPILATWEAMDAAIASGLGGLPVVLEDRHGVLTVHGITVSGAEDGALLASAVVSVEAKGRIGRILSFLGANRLFREQLLEMAGRPVLAAGGTGIALDGLEMTSGSSFLLRAVARMYGWFADQTVEDLAERHAVVDLRARLADLEADAQDTLDELTRNMAERGVAVSLDLRSEPRLSALAVQPDGLAARLCAGADVELELQSLAF